MSRTAPISSVPERPDAPPRPSNGASVEGDTFSALFDAKLDDSSFQRPAPSAGPTAPSTPWTRAESPPEWGAGPEGQWGARGAPAEETPRTDRTEPSRKEDAPRASDEEGAEATSASDGREGTAQPSSASSSEAEASEDVAEPAALRRLAKTDAAVVRAQTTEADAAGDEAAAEVEVPEVAVDAADAVDGVEFTAPVALAVDKAVGATARGAATAVDGVDAVALDGPRGPRALGAMTRVVKAAASAGASGFDPDLIERLQASQQLAQLKDGRLRLSIDQGAERVTLTMLERDGSVSLAARTASRDIADALETHVQELEAALGEHGLSLDSFEAHSDAPDGEADGASPGSSEGGQGPDDEVERTLPIYKRRIIA